MSDKTLPITIDPSLIRSIVRQTIALHKSAVRQRDLAREVARSLPRDAVKAKAEANAALRAALSGGEITPEKAMDIIERLSTAERMLKAWKEENAELIKQLSVVSTNMWVHINALKSLGASLPELPEEG